MRIYFSKKWLKGFALVAVLVIAVLLLLRIVFIWDQKQGVVDTGNTQPTAPPQHTNEEITNISEETPDIADETTDIPASEPANNPKKPSQESADESRVDLIISKIYALRSEYVSKISRLEAEAKAEKEGMAADERLALAERITGEAVILEQECDAQMNIYLQELEVELRRLGRDMSLISEIRSVYQQEKEQKKSQLLDKYSKYFQ